MKLCPLCETAYPNQTTHCGRDGARLIESRDLEPGTMVRDKYRIERVLGRGGMGTVYLAEHMLLGRRRALKFISVDLSRDPKFLRRFRMEAQAASDLRHPNIIEVVDLDQAEDGSPFIAMEYVEGPGLRQAIQAGAFRVERALDIAHGIALGLGRAHVKGIVHRDVKPENVLLAGGNGIPETPKLLDFGIAAMRESSTALSQTRGLMLTPEYAAPEQWKGMRAEELDGRVDLYALGGVLHEMLTGRTSFRAHNTEGWMYQHLQAELVPPSWARPELAQWPGLDALVMRLLAKNRDDRPANVGEFVRELEMVRTRRARPETKFETRVEAPPIRGHRETVAEFPPRSAVQPPPPPPPAWSHAAQMPVAAQGPARRDNVLLAWRVALAAINLPLAGFGLPFHLDQYEDKAFGSTTGMMVRLGIAFGLVLLVWMVPDRKTLWKLRSLVFVPASVAAAVLAWQVPSHWTPNHLIPMIISLGAVLLALACLVFLRCWWGGAVVAAPGAVGGYFLLTAVLASDKTEFGKFMQGYQPLFWQIGFFLGIFFMPRIWAWWKQKRTVSVREQAVYGRP